MVGAEVEAFAATVGESARAFEDAVPAVAAMPRRTNRTAIAAMEIVRLGVDTGIIANLKAGRAVQDALAALADLTRGADAATCLSASVTSAAMLPIALMIDARPAAELKAAAAGRLAAPAAANRARRTRGRWSLRSPLHDASLPLSPAAAMLSLRSTLRPTRAPLSIKVAFHFGEERFRVQLEPDGLFIEREAHPFLPSALPRRIMGRPALELELDTRSFRRIFYGKEPLEAALEKGAPDGLTLKGDRALCARFIASFALPPKLSLPVPASVSDPAPDPELGS